MICSQTGTVTLGGLVISSNMTEADIGALTSEQRMVHGSGVSYRLRTPGWACLVLFVGEAIDSVSLSYQLGHAQTLDEWSAKDERSRCKDHDKWLSLWLGPPATNQPRWQEHVFSWGTASSGLDPKTGDASIIVSYGRRDAAPG
jgi:hypothetical protein